MTGRNTYISVVIPTYNEQARIADTLYKVKDYLARQPFNSEIIVVDDGSVDTTAEVVRVVDIYQQEFKQQPSCFVVSNVTNSGKGYSVARGCSHAVGELVLFMDADSATPISEVEKLLTDISYGYDVVIGNRTADSTHDRPALRKFTSRLFNQCIRLLRLSNSRDTQCGFKLYRREAVQQIIQHQTISRWCFDVEHLYIAEKLGFSIANVPVQWEHKHGSKIHLLRDPCKMLLELLKIRLSHGRRLAPARNTSRQQLTQRKFPFEL